MRPLQIVGQEVVVLNHEHRHPFKQPASGCIGLPSNTLAAGPVEVPARLGHFRPLQDRKQKQAHATDQGGRAQCNDNESLFSVGLFKVNDPKNTLWRDLVPATYDWQPISLWGCGPYSLTSLVMSGATGRCWFMPRDVSLWSLGTSA